MDEETRRIIRTGLIVLLTLILLAGGLFSLPPYQAAADDLPIEEGTPLPPGLEEYVPDQIIVKFKEGLLRASMEQLNQTMGTEVAYASPCAGFKVLKIPKGKTVAEMVETYSKQPNVEYAEPNYIYRITWSPDDFYYSYQWHFDQINLEAAWDLDTTSPNYGGDSSIVVAVIDSGVAYETYSSYVQAPDLANTNFTSGQDFVNSDAHPNDDNCHGTHVCGTIAQSTNNTMGVAGIAFNTTIMPIKAFDSTGWGTAAWIADGFYYAANNGAHIINYSAGGPHSTTLENAVVYARNAGVIIIAAAGNDYQTGNDPSYPAAYDDYVIAVGATRYDQTRSYYSNTGSYLDIAAPGGDTNVDQNSDNFSDGVLQQTFNPSTQNVTDFAYWFLDGTSMATPHVAGVAALVLAEHPTWTAAQVRHALLSTVTDKGSAGKDNEYGWGLLDACDSVNSTLVTPVSYSDAAHTTTCDNFTDYATENTTYMYCTGLLPSQNYGVAYYDGGNTRRDTDNVTSGASGNLSSQHTFVQGTEANGTWHVIVYDQAHTPPSTYSSNWTYTIGEDTYILQFVIPTMETIVEAEGQYYNTAPILSNFGFDDDEALDDGWYQMDSYNGTWAVLFTDNASSSWDSDNWSISQSEFDALNEGSHTIYFKASDNATNVVGDSGEWGWQFYKDTTPPSDPTSVNSTSHTTSVWSSDNTVSVNWTDATDNLSGLDGYSILWNTSANTTPSANKTIEEGIGNVTSSELIDDNSHYFHIRSKDNAGNWQSTVHLGPFYIDTTPPTDPTSVNSTSHTISVWSSDNTVDITWTDATDNLSDLDGYSILWNTSANTTPSANKTIEEGIGNVTSSELADGNSHYFHIRSKDNAGNWQSTVHLGPFFIAVNAPFLSDGIVSPASGYTSANFTYSVNYTDFENEAPSSITVSIDGGASENMTVKSGQDANFTNGEIYEYSTIGANLGVGTNHTYQFSASDGTDNATGDIGQHDGPTVSRRPSTPGGGAGGGGGGGGGAAGITPVLNSVTEKGRFTEDVTAKSDDRKAELYIPQNTIGLNRVGQLISSILMKVMEKEEAPATPADSEYIGSVYRLGPDGATFDPMIDLTIKYDESKIPEGVAEKNLVVATFDSTTGQWENLDSTVHLKDDKVTAKVGHFTAFAILAHTSPASFTVTDLSITPDEVNVGESLTISVLVTNTGDLTGSYEVTMQIDDMVVQTKEVILDGGDSETISFSLTPDTAGEYVINISGLLGTGQVKAPEAPAAFTTSTLTISPDEVTIGEIVTISVLVTNTGDLTGTCKVSLKIDNILEETKEITLDGGESQKIVFTAAKESTGTCKVEIDGLTDSFIVQEEVPSVAKEEISITPAPEPVVKPAPTPEPTPAPEFNWWLISSIIAGVVTAGLVSYFLVRKRRKAKG